MRKLTELQSDTSTGEKQKQFSALHFYMFGVLLSVPWQCNCLKQLIVQRERDPDDVVNRSSYLSKIDRVEGVEFQLDWQKDDVLKAEPIWNPDWITCRVKSDKWGIMLHCNLLNEGYLSQFQGDEKAATKWLKNLEKNKPAFPQNVLANNSGALH